MLSLFSGVGGLDLGFVQAGFSPIGAYDIWKTAVDVYKTNLSGNAEVLDLSTSDVSPNDTPDVVIAGSPCQGFSVIGMRRVHDPRNSLFVRAAHLAVQLDPQVIVLENVPGIVAGKHKQYYDAAVIVLEAAGFSVRRIELSALDAGLPQRRRRVFLIATRSCVSLDIRRPSAHLNIERTILACESRHNHDPIVLTKQTKDYEIARAIRPGQKLCDVRGGSSSVHSWDIPSVFGQTDTKATQGTGSDNAFAKKN